jgi:predicted amino acid-binding ACT domain protein
MEYICNNINDVNIALQQGYVLINIKYPKWYESTKQITYHLRKEEKKNAIKITVKHNDIVSVIADYKNKGYNLIQTQYGETVNYLTFSVP